MGGHDFEFTIRPNFNLDSLTQFRNQINSARLEIFEMHDDIGKAMEGMDAPARLLNEQLDRCVVTADNLVKLTEDAGKKLDSGKMTDAEKTATFQQLQNGFEDFKTFKSMLQGTDFDGNFSVDLAKKMFGGLPSAIQAEINTITPQLTGSLRRFYNKLNTQSGMPSDLGSVRGIASHAMKDASISNILNGTSLSAKQKDDVLRTMVTLTRPIQFSKEYQTERFGQGGPKAPQKITDVESILPELYKGSYANKGYSFAGTKHAQIKSSAVLSKDAMDQLQQLISSDAVVARAAVNSGIASRNAEGKLVLSGNITRKRLGALSDEAWNEYYTRTKGLYRKVNDYYGLSAKSDAERQEIQDKIINRSLNGTGSMALTGMSGISDLMLAKGNFVKRNEETSAERIIENEAKRLKEQYIVEKINPFVSGSKKSSDVSLAESQVTRMLGLQGHNYDKTDAIKVISLANYDEKNPAHQKMIADYKQNGYTDDNGQQYVFHTIHGTGEDAVIRMIRKNDYEAVRERYKPLAGQLGFKGDDIWNTFIPRDYRFKSAAEFGKHQDQLNKMWTDAYETGIDLSSKNFAFVDFSKIDPKTKKVLQGAEQFSDGLGFVGKGIIPHDAQVRMGLSGKGSLVSLDQFETMGDWAKAAGLLNEQGQFMLPGRNGELIDVSKFHGLIDNSVIKNKLAYEGMTNEQANNALTGMIRQFPINLVTDYSYDGAAKGLGSQMMSFIKLSPQLMMHQGRALARRMLDLDTLEGMRRYVFNNPDDYMSKLANDPQYGDQYLLSDPRFQKRVDIYRNSLLRSAAAGEFLELDDIANIKNERILRNPLTAYALTNGGLSDEVLSNYGNILKNAHGREFSNDEVLKLITLENGLADFEHIDSDMVAATRSPTGFGQVIARKNYAKVLKPLYEQLGLETYGVQFNNADMKRLAGADMDADEAKTIVTKENSDGIDLVQEIKNYSDYIEELEKQIPEASVLRKEFDKVKGENTVDNVLNWIRTAALAVGAPAKMGYMSGIGARLSMLDSMSDKAKMIARISMKGNVGYDQVTTDVKKPGESLADSEMMKALGLGYEYQKLPGSIEDLYNVKAQPGEDGKTVYTTLDDKTVINPSNVFQTSGGRLINLETLKGFDDTKLDRTNFPSIYSSSVMQGLLTGSVLARHGYNDDTITQDLLEAFGVVDAKTGSSGLSFGNVGPAVERIMKNKRGMLAQFAGLSRFSISEEEASVLASQYAEAMQEIESDADKLMEKSGQRGKVLLEDGTTQFRKDYISDRVKAAGLNQIALALGQYDKLGGDLLNTGVTRANLEAVYGKDFAGILQNSSDLSLIDTTRGTFSPAYDKYAKYYTVGQNEPSYVQPSVSNVPVPPGSPTPPTNPPTNPPSPPSGPPTNPPSPPSPPNPPSGPPPEFDYDRLISGIAEQDRQMADSMLSGENSRMAAQNIKEDMDRLHGSFNKEIYQDMNATEADVWYRKNNAMLNKLHRTFDYATVHGDNSVFGKDTVLGRSLYESDADLEADYVRARAARFTRATTNNYDKFIRLAEGRGDASDAQVKRMEDMQKLIDEQISERHNYMRDNETRPDTDQEAFRSKISDLDQQIEQMKQKRTESIDRMLSQNEQMFSDMGAEFEHLIDGTNKTSEYKIAKKVKETKEGLIKYGEQLNEFFEKHLISENVYNSLKAVQEGQLEKVDDGSFEKMLTRVSKQRDKNDKEKRILQSNSNAMSLVSEATGRQISPEEYARLQADSLKTRIKGRRSDLQEMLRDKSLDADERAAYENELKSLNSIDMRSLYSRFLGANKADQTIKDTKKAKAITSLDRLFSGEKNVSLNDALEEARQNAQAQVEEVIKSFGLSNKEATQFRKRYSDTSAIENRIREQYDINRSRDMVHAQELLAKYGLSQRQATEQTKQTSGTQQTLQKQQEDVNAQIAAAQAQAKEATQENAIISKPSVSAAEESKKVLSRAKILDTEIKKEADALANTDAQISKVESQISNKKAIAEKEKEIDKINEAMSNRKVSQETLDRKTTLQQEIAKLQSTLPQEDTTVENLENKKTELQNERTRALKRKTSLEARRSNLEPGFTAEDEQNAFELIKKTTESKIRNDSSLSRKEKRNLLNEFNTKGITSLDAMMKEINNPNSAIGQRMETVVQADTIDNKIVSSIAKDITNRKSKQTTPKSDRAEYTKTSDEQRKESAERAAEEDRRKTEETENQRKRAVVQAARPEIQPEAQPTQPVIAQTQQAPAQMPIDITGQKAQYMYQQAKLDVIDTAGRLRSYNTPEAIAMAKQLEDAFNSRSEEERTAEFRRQIEQQEQRSLEDRTFASEQSGRSLNRQIRSSRRMSSGRGLMGRIQQGYYAREDQRFALQAQERNLSRRIEDEERRLSESGTYQALKAKGEFRTNEEEAQYQKQTEALENYKKQLKDVQGAQEGMGKGNSAFMASFDGINQSISRVTSMLGRRMFHKATQEVVQFAKQFDKSMATIQMITLKSDDAMSKLGDNLLAKAKDLKVTFSDLASVEEALYRQGLSDEQVQEREEDIVKFSKVAGIDAKAATKLVTVALNTGLVSSAQEATDIVTALGDNAATNAAEIEKGIEKAGAAAAADGTTFAELASMLTAITSTTQIGGNVAGRTLNTIMGRMNKIGTNEIIYDENGNAVSGSAVAKLLKEQGVETYQNGKKRSTYDVLYDLSQKWDTISDATQQQIATQLAGTRQYSNFAAIMQGMSEGKVDEYMQLASGAEGTVGEKFDVYEETLEAKLARIKDTFDQSIKEMFDSGVIDDFTNAIENSINLVSNLVSAFGGFKNAIPILTTVIGLIKGFAVASSIASTMETMGKTMGGWGLAVGALAGMGIGGLIGGQITKATETKTEKETATERYSKYLDKLDEKYKDNQETIDKATKLRNRGEYRTEEEELEYKQALSSLVVSINTDIDFSELARSMNLAAESIDGVTDRMSALELIAKASGATLDDYADEIIKIAEESDKENKIRKIQASVSGAGAAIDEKAKDQFYDEYYQHGGYIYDYNETQDREGGPKFQSLSQLIRKNESTGKYEYFQDYDTGSFDSYTSSALTNRAGQKMYKYSPFLQRIVDVNNSPGQGGNVLRTTIKALLAEPGFVDDLTENLTLPEEIKNDYSILNTYFAHPGNLVSSSYTGDQKKSVEKLMDRVLTKVFDRIGTNYETTGNTDLMAKDSLVNSLKSSDYITNLIGSLSSEYQTPEMTNLIVDYLANEIIKDPNYSPHDSSKTVIEQHLQDFIPDGTEYDQIPTLLLEKLAKVKQREKYDYKSAKNAYFKTEEGEYISPQEAQYRHDVNFAMKAVAHNLKGENDYLFENAEGIKQSYSQVVNGAEDAEAAIRAFLENGGKILKSAAKDIDQQGSSFDDLHLDFAEIYNASSAALKRGYGNIIKDEKNTVALAADYALQVLSGVEDTEEGISNFFRTMSGTQEMSDLANVLGSVYPDYEFNKDGSVTYKGSGQGAGKSKIEALLKGSSYSYGTPTETTTKKGQFAVEALRNLTENGWYMTEEDRQRAEDALTAEYNAAYTAAREENRDIGTKEDYFAANRERFSNAALDQIDREYLREAIGNDNIYAQLIGENGLFNQNVSPEVLRYAQRRTEAYANGMTDLSNADRAKGIQEVQEAIAAGNLTGYDESTAALYMANVQGADTYMAAQRSLEAYNKANNTSLSMAQLSTLQKGTTEYDQFKDAIGDVYGSMEEAIQAQKSWDGMLQANSLRLINKYGEYTESAAKAIEGLSAGGKTAMQTMAGLRASMLKLQDVKTAIDKSRGKSGAQLGSKEADLLSSYLGIDVETLKKYTKEGLDSTLNEIGKEVDEEFNATTFLPIVTSAMEEIQTALNENKITLDQAVEIQTQLEVGDLSGLTDTLTALGSTLAGDLESVSGELASATIRTIITGGDGNYDIQIVGSTSGLKSGNGYNGKGGGGGGGGKSKVDELLAKQKHNIASLEHENKMLDIEKQHYDNMNEYGKQNDTIDKQIELQYRLKDAYAANIREMEEMLAKEKEDSDDWWKLKEAIDAAEESMASVKNTITDLNKSKIDILEQEQENANKPTAHNQSMLEKLSERALTEERFKDYETFTKQQIEEINTQKELNDTQIQAWIKQLKNYEYGEEAWIAVRDKIWEKEEENAELENKAIQQTLALNQQRLSQIATVLDHNTGAAAHNNTIADTFANLYQTGGYRKQYEEMLNAQISTNKKIIEENKKAEESAKAQLESLDKYTPAWYEAQKAVYQYQETIAQTIATQEELNRTLAENNLEKVQETYTDATRDVIHVNSMLESQAQEYLDTRDYKAYSEAMSKYIDNVTIQLKAEREALATLQKQYDEGMQSGTLDRTMQRQYLDSINEREEAIQQLELNQRSKTREIDKTNLEKLFSDQETAESEYNHNLQLVQYQATKYQNAGELTNYSKALQMDTALRKDRIDVLNDEIKELEKEQEYYQKKYGEGTESEIRIVEQIKKREEALASENVQIEKNNKLLEENEKKIRQIQKTLEDAVDKEIEAQKKREREILSSNVSMQNTILDLVKKRLQDEWDLKKKDIEKEKESLNEYKRLINERFNYRKKASQQADKDEELAEYRRQLALIEADTSRTKDAKELRRKIEELEKEKAWTIAEDELANENERIDDNIQSLDDYVSYNEEKMNELLSDANNFATELSEILSGTYEEAYDKVVQYFKKYNEAYIKSLPDAQKQTIQNLQDTLKTAKDILDSNYKEITDTLYESDGSLRSKEDVISWFADTDLEYRKAREQNDENTMRILETQWSEYYDNLLNAQVNNAKFNLHDHTVGDVTSKIDELKDNIFKVQTVDISGNPVNPYGFDEDSGMYVDRSTGERYSANDYSNIYYVAPEPEPVVEEPVQQKQTQTYTKKKYNVYDEKGFKTNYTVEAYSKSDAERKIKEQYGLDVSTSKYYSVVTGPNANGGLIDYTGLAWVDGSMNRPESFLDSVDTELLREILDTYSYVKSTPYMSSVDTARYTNNTTVGDVNITINQAEINNDADINSLAKRIGQAFTKELKINGVNTAGYSFA